MKEDGFLRAIRDDLADDTTALVYADWLDEQGDAVSSAKAQFLRFTLELEGPPTADLGWGIRRRLQALAATLDQGWLAVVSRLKIESCQGKAKAAGAARLMAYQYVCDRRWEDLTPTDAPTVRHCEECSQSVYYCDDIRAARDHAMAGHCVAVALNVIRRDDDLTKAITLGKAGIL